MNRIGQRASMEGAGLPVTEVVGRDWGYNTRGELDSGDVPGAASDRGFGYDPFGRRIARILGNITELTLYDGWK